jgi:hypothetical protein
MPPASDPACGSVSAKAASFFPSAKSGRNRCFSSSLPERIIGIAPRALLAKLSAMPPHALESSSVTNTMFIVPEPNDIPP